MNHSDVPKFLGLLVAMLAAAKMFGGIVQRFGQPAVLGELIAGVALGTSAIGLVDPTNETLQLLAELGVVILLFEIGLETELSNLLRVGRAATLVAIVGVVLPFALGYGMCRWLGLENLVAVVAGATLTATSVGITARVLSDLRRLSAPESQIILGAAVLDDVIGLIILAIVSGLTDGDAVTVVGVVKTAAVGVGFLVGTLVLGRILLPPIIRGVSRVARPGTLAIWAVMLALGLAWLASTCGSAMIIGAFAAGLLLRRSEFADDIGRGVAHLGHFFVPLFFVSVGAAVDVSRMNPFDGANHRTLLVGILLIAVAVTGKFLAGYAPFWFAGDKRVIGVGMIPRGEVGLIFAQRGLVTGVFDSEMFSALMLMVMATTFIAPPLLRLLLPPAAGKTEPKPEGIESLVNEP